MFSLCDPKNGPEAVLSWTRKRKVDVMHKHLIIIPVCLDGHYLLFAVLNPGQVVARPAGKLSAGKDIVPL